jgi:hypothetical protein
MYICVYVCMCNYNYMYGLNHVPEIRLECVYAYRKRYVYRKREAEICMYTCGCWCTHSHIYNSFLVFHAAFTTLLPMHDNNMSQCAPRGMHVE